MQGYYITGLTKNRVGRILFNEKMISFEEHLTWLNNKFNDPDKARIFIAEDNSGNDIGQIRFDKNGKNVFIDYSITVNLRGLGLGKLILVNGCKTIKKIWSDIEYIIGEVKLSNTASQKAFIKAGFKESCNEDKIIYCLEMK